MVEHAMHGSKQSAEELVSRYKLALEVNSWLCNFMFSEILISHVFEKQTKKRLSLKTQFKIEFLLRFTGIRKVQ